MNVINLGRLTQVVLMATLFTCSQVAAAQQMVSTDFEFDDASGSFTIGTPPVTAMFEGGPATTRSVGSLYRSGSHAWMVGTGDVNAPGTGAVTGTVAFERPPSAVDFFIRNDSNVNGGRARVLDVNGALITELGATATAFQQVTVNRTPAETLIGRVEIVNDGGGEVAVEDFSFTAAFDPNNPIPAKIPTGSVEIELTEIATGLTAPNLGVHAPGDSTRLFVVDQPGQIVAIDLATGAQTVFLDVSNRLVVLGNNGPGTFDERGLLGLAFHSDYQTNGRLYTYTSEPVMLLPDFSTIPGGETADHQSVIAEWTVQAPADPASEVNVSTRRELLRIDQPQFNHDGGALVFGADKLLYIALGDGGGADDEGVGHGANGNGRDATNPLGAILRIDPLGTDSTNGEYGIPGTNPFANGTGGQVREIFAYGFRNPFRIDYDAQTGIIWVADVGQNAIEEIDVINPADITASNNNYGWNYKEGTFFFEGNGAADGTVTDTDPGGVPANLVDPDAQYDHDEGIAIIGGFVYRGTEIPELEGRYVFGDFGGVDAGRLFYLTDNNTISAFEINSQTKIPQAVNGFGQDANGELYVMTNTTGTPSGSTGAVFRIDPQSGVGITPGGGGGGGGCVLTQNAAFDPLLPALVLLAMLYILSRRYGPRKR